MSTPNKLPPLLDELLRIARMAEALKRECGMDPESPQADRNLQYMAISYAIRNVAEALRQSQSLPAGAVAGLVGKWRVEAEKLRKGGGRAQRRGDLADADVAYTAAQDACAYADELEQALQADAREKGEAADHRCVWTQDSDDGSWDTECGEKHQFFDGSPSDNTHKFCPYCGGNLIQGGPEHPNA